MVPDIITISKSFGGTKASVAATIVRTKVYKKVLNLKKEMHFSVEGLKIAKRQDIKKIEDIWMVKQTLPECLKNTIK